MFLLNHLLLEYSFDINDLMWPLTYSKYGPASEMFWDLGTHMCCVGSRKKKEGNEIDILHFINEVLWATMIAG